jgi:hypothetical protein
VEGGPSQSTLVIRHIDVDTDKTMVDANLVFVRWVTIDNAIKTAKLQRIPTDPRGFDKSITLDAFYQAAHQRLSAAGGLHPSGVTLKLWLKECPLSAKDNLNTLDEVRLEGTMQEPLDVFVQLVLPTHETFSLSQLLRSTYPRDIWGLDASQRGVTTFATCLHVLFKDIARGHISVETILDVLLELVRFPPVLLAFEELRSTGMNDYSTDFSSFQLLAEVFSAICSTMVPDWVCLTSESKLEGCRAVFAWIRGLCVDAKQLSPPKHVHKIQIFEPLTKTNGVMRTTAIYGDPEIVELTRVAKMATSTSPTGTTASALAASLETPVPGLARRYVLAGNIRASQGYRCSMFVQPPRGWADFASAPTLHRPGAADYDNLLSNANKDPVFRMIGPMKLGSCLSAQLPVITLSAQGFVSAYDQQDYECSEREFYLWNLVERRVVLKNVNPGEFLSRGLEPIIRERKKAGCWEVDAWAEWTEQASHGDPDECIVVCVDVSGSMTSRMPHGWNPTRDSRGETASRLEEVKDFFSQFSTRLSSYGLATNVGLVTFSSRQNVVTAQPLTALQLDFRDGLTNAKAYGSTAIFNAIDTAKGREFQSLAQRRLSRHSEQATD